MDGFHFEGDKSPMILTLTPELTQAIEEKAQEQSTPPECLALHELNRAFLDTDGLPFGRDTSTERIDLVNRRYRLIEKNSRRD